MMIKHSIGLVWLTGLIGLEVLKVSGLLVKAVLVINWIVFLIYKLKQQGRLAVKIVQPILHQAMGLHLCSRAYIHIEPRWHLLHQGVLIDIMVRKVLDEK
jgi:hypothetical protein